MTSIYNLSWGETSFLAKLQLFFKSRNREKQKMRSDDPQVQAQGYSALSSTYYSIVGTAFAQLKATLRPIWLVWFAPVRVVAWCFTWLPLAVWCYWRMLSLSNRIVEIIGYEGMSANQCDVRQSILRRRNRFEEARVCIKAALKKNPATHTLGLLIVGLADTWRYEGNWRKVEKLVEEALCAAKKVEQEDPRQAARIYRGCASLTDFFEMGDPIPGSQLRRKAKALLETVSANDQLLKI